MDVVSDQKEENVSMTCHCILVDAKCSEKSAKAVILVGAINLPSISRFDSRNNAGYTASAWAGKCYLLASSMISLPLFFSPSLRVGHKQ